MKRLEEKQNELEMRMSKQEEENVKINESIDLLRGKQEDLEMRVGESMKEFVKKNEFGYELAKSEWNLTKNPKKQLEEWTSLKCNDILFDSNVDNWSEGTSVFNQRIIGKKQLTFLIEDEDGEIFGYYLNTKVVKDDEDWQVTDSKSFLFNLQSKNNRLKHPMKFEIKDLKNGGIWFIYSSAVALIYLGDIRLMKENYKNQSCCNQDEDNFDYHGIENVLCGKTGGFPHDFFTLKRILVIQMK